MLELSLSQIKLRCFNMETSTKYAFPPGGGGGGRGGEHLFEHALASYTGVSFSTRA